MAIIKLKKDKNAPHFELKTVQDVKVNDTSVFDGEEANIRLKTINEQSLLGNGNIDLRDLKIKYLNFDDFVQGKPTQENIDDIMQNDYDLIKLYSDNATDGEGVWYQLQEFNDTSSRKYKTFVYVDIYNNYIRYIIVSKESTSVATFNAGDDSYDFILTHDNTLIGNGTAQQPLKVNPDLLDEAYTITVPRFAHKLIINDNDLAYIRNKKPRTLKIVFSETDNIINLILNSSNTASIDYSNIMNTGQYELFAYFLKINASDTEQTGCEFSWANYIVAPEMPMFAQNKTYVLKLINEVPIWVEEN